MEFNSIAFALFFPTVFIIYWMTTARWLRMQNLLLLASSYLFYAYWDWRFLLLIVTTTVSTYITARLAATRPQSARAWTAANIVLNIGILILFKYFNFFSENLGRLLGILGWQADWFFLDILVPVGISFYTFQAIGYSIDVYRRKICPSTDLLSFATFIAYFPQLVAGPIEKASFLLPQIEQPRRFDYEAAVWGLRRVLWGLFKKVVIADSCSIYVDRGFSNIYITSSPYLTMCAVLFTIQIYCDFSGYCDIAQGLSRMLGIRLSDNFNRPYTSRSVLEFWRRWHISLMHWFRDYVYIPLGGSRHGRAVTYRNVLIVFLLSGLWHGAAWTFVSWGLYWGLICIIANIAGIKNHGKDPQHPTFGDLPSIAVTMIFVIASRILYRSPDLQFMIHFVSCAWPAFVGLAILCVAGAFALSRIPRLAPVPLYPWRPALLQRRGVRYAIYMIMFTLIITGAVNDRPFIYFQF